MGVKVRKFGTLYLGQDPVTPFFSTFTTVGGKDIRICDSLPDQEIEWVEYDGLLMARTPLLTRVSFKDLALRNLVLGEIVHIDGKDYELRLLRGGRQAMPSEDDLWVQKVRADTGDIWLLPELHCWGCQYLKREEQSSLVEGALTALDDPSSPVWSSVIPLDTRSLSIGWRPVLEPMNLDPDDIPLGSRILVYFAKGSEIRGSLQEVTDYDLVLSEWGSPKRDDTASKICGRGLIAISRKTIKQIRRDRKQSGGSL